MIGVCVYVECIWKLGWSRRRSAFLIPNLCFEPLFFVALDYMTSFI